MLNNFVKHSIIRFVTQELTTILDINSGGWSSTTVHYKVNYLNDPFYMNKVDGSYDESLHMLIHRIMYVEKHYLRFLDSELMNEVEEDPHSRWWIDEDHKDFEKIDDFLFDIYFDCIGNVYEYLTNKVGIDVKEEFKDYLNLE